MTSSGHPNQATTYCVLPLFSLCIASALLCITRGDYHLTILQNLEPVLNSPLPPSLPPCPPPSNRQFTFTPPVPSTPVLPSWPKIWSAQLLDCLLLASSLKGRAGYVLRSQMTRLTCPTTICSAKASLLNSGRATGLKRKYDMRKCAMCRASIPPSKHPRKWQRYCYPCVLKNKRWKINIIHSHHCVCHCLKDSEERIGADWDGVTVLEDNNDRQAVIMPEYFATAIESRK